MILVQHRNPIMGTAILLRLNIHGKGVRLLPHPFVISVNIRRLETETMAKTYQTNKKAIRLSLAILAGLILGALFGRIPPDLRACVERRSGLNPSYSV